jgi:MFS family permease
MATPSASNIPAPASAPLTTTQWLIVVLASIGFAFDIYELLMAPLILPPAIPELTGFKPGSPEFLDWVARMLYIPAFAGGIFGLLGGYLTDLWGRRRVLTWSILLYAVSAFLAGYSTSIYMLLFLRCTTFVGVCVEFVAAVAWLAELFPEPHRRESILGYTQAFSSFGGLLVAGANALALKYADQLPAVAVPEFLTSLAGAIPAAHQHEGWRYTLMSGLIPALPLILIRPFLPESPVWAAKKAAGTLKRPSILELFAPRFRRTTIVTALMFACSYGVAFGAIQQMTQIVPGAPEVKAAGEGKPIPAQKKIGQEYAARTGMIQEIGGLVGRMLLAFLAVRIVSRRKLLRLFQWPDLIIAPLMFVLFATGSLLMMQVGIFFVGLLTVAQFSFWGNYLPRVYPVHLRGTGEGFAANIGGRMIGTSMAYVTSKLAIGLADPTLDKAASEAAHPGNVAYAAAAVAAAVLLVGSILSFFLPEPGLEDPAE